LGEDRPRWTDDPDRRAVGSSVVLEPGAADHRAESGRFCDLDLDGERVGGAANLTLEVGAEPVRGQPADHGREDDQDHQRQGR
jgi:hypothetical protein